jgi:hypothetical protein
MEPSKVLQVEIPDSRIRKLSTHINKWDWDRVLKEISTVPALQISVVAWWHYRRSCGEVRILRTSVKGQNLIVWIQKETKNE